METTDITGNKTNDVRFDLSKKFEELAKHYLDTKKGIGMIPPFYAETASAKGNQDWPFWIVRNKSCNSLGQLMSKELAIVLAEAMNKLSGIE